jgi:hypothetical protein
MIRIIPGEEKIDGEKFIEWCEKDCPQKEGTFDIKKCGGCENEKECDDLII